MGCPLSVGVQSGCSGSSAIREVGVRTMRSPLFFLALVLPAVPGAERVEEMLPDIKQAQLSRTRVASASVTLCLSGKEFQDHLLGAHFTREGDQVQLLKNVDGDRAFGIPKYEGRKELAGNARIEKRCDAFCLLFRFTRQGVARVIEDNGFAGEASNYSKLQPFVEA